MLQLQCDIDFVIFSWALPKALICWLFRSEKQGAEGAHYNSPGHRPGYETNQKQRAESEV